MYLLIIRFLLSYVHTIISYINKLLFSSLDDGTNILGTHTEQYISKLVTGGIPLNNKFSAHDHWYHNVPNKTILYFQSISYNYLEHQSYI